jgi:hypothetical protein
MEFELVQPDQAPSCAGDAANGSNLFNGHTGRIREKGSAATREARNDGHILSMDIN